MAKAVGCGVVAGHYSHWNIRPLTSALLVQLRGGGGVRGGGGSLVIGSCGNAFTGESETPQNARPVFTSVSCRRAGRRSSPVTVQHLGPGCTILCNLTPGGRQPRCTCACSSAQVCGGSSTCTRVLMRVCVCVFLTAQVLGTVDKTKTDGP